MRLSPTNKQLDIKEYQGSEATGNILIYNVCCLTLHFSSQHPSLLMAGMLHI